MKHRIEGTPLAWVGWLALGILLASTLAAWWFSLQTESSALVIEPLPAQIIEVRAPDWTESNATTNAVANEEQLGNGGDSREISAPAEPQNP
jgi:hypothetical protein